ncbi:MAG: molybdopterin-binding protein [Myxococcota bacterium]
MKRPAYLKSLGMIGDELLDGRVADTNTLRLAQALEPLGLTISRRSTVPDDISVIIAEAENIAQRGTDLCIVCGGLGPTTDDLTREAFAQLNSVALIVERRYHRILRARFAARGLRITGNQLRQAERPAELERVDQSRGHSPGFYHCSRSLHVC